MSYFVPSIRGGKKLVAEDSHIYIFEREKNSKCYWSCEKANCKGRVHTLSGSPEVIKVAKEHSHPPIPGRGLALKITGSMKKKAEASTCEPPRSIISTMERVPDAVAAQIPTITNLTQTIRRHRNAKQAPLVQNWV